MKLKQIVCDKTDLTLTKEKKIVKYNEEFEVSDERAAEILKVTFKGKPVAAMVEDKVVIDNEAIIDDAQVKDDEVVPVIAEEVEIKKKTSKKK